MSSKEGPVVRQGTGMATPTITTKPLGSLSRLVCFEKQQLAWRVSRDMKGSPVCVFRDVVNERVLTSS